MMRVKNICTALCLLSLANLACADVKDGFFLGLGAGSNSMSVSQQASTNGNIDVHQEGDTPPPLVADGGVSGTASSFDESASSTIPQIQVGYSKHFVDSDYLWGTKLSYQYIGQTSTNNNVNDIALDDLVSTGGGSYAGNISASSVQTTLNHEFAFVPFIGRSFTNSYVYFGAGPALFEVESQVNGLKGYADVNDVPNDGLGVESTLSSSKWVWGGVAQLGVTYYFETDWFVDANYTYAITQNYSENYSTPFAGAFSNGNSVYDASGTANMNTSQQITNQTLFVSINKML